MSAVKVCSHGTSKAAVVESPSNITRQPFGGSSAISGPRRPNELIRTVVSNSTGHGRGPT